MPQIEIEIKSSKYLLNSKLKHQIMTYTLTQNKIHRKSAIFHPIPTQKWDKNKNNGFGLGPQFLIIKSTKIE